MADTVRQIRRIEYATEGLSQNLFVSKYRLQLPSEDDIRKYMLENITEEQFKEMMEEEIGKDNKPNKDIFSTKQIAKNRHQYERR